MTPSSASAAPLELNVEYRRLNSFVADYVRSIRAGSLFIKSATPLPTGTRLVFSLRVPGLEGGSGVRLDGIVDQVTRAEDVAGKPGAEPGMLVRFEFSNESARADLHERIQRHIVRSLGERTYRALVDAASK